MISIVCADGLNTNGLLFAEQSHGGNMENTVWNALIPLATAVLAEAAQILTALIQGKPLQELKWWRMTIITTAAAIVAIASTFMIISNATKCAITNLGWQPYSNDGLGSTIIVNPVAGSNCAFQISFDLKHGGYVATYKKLEPKFLVWWIKGIEFSYSGMGNPNTIEFKLFDTASSQYKVVLGHATDTGGKTLSVRIPYGVLTDPFSGRIFKRDGFVLDRMDFSFSSWPNDTPGTGTVIIHDIRVVLVWQIWLIILSPILVIGIAAYVLWQKSNSEK